MFRIILPFPLLLWFSFGTLCAQEYRQLPLIPDREGFAGVFSGTSHGVLMVAGGANFPDAKPWDGGKKKWYSQVLALRPNSREWVTATQLPSPRAYGVSVTYENKLICIGGSNESGHRVDAIQLEWESDHIKVSTLPDLPIPIANACGSILKDVIFVVGGQHEPDAVTASKQVWTLSLSAANPRWIRLTDLPGEGRILAMAATVKDSLIVVGGAALLRNDQGGISRKYLDDGYRWQQSVGWTRITDMPHAIVGAPSPAPTFGNRFYILGGDDGDQLKFDPRVHRGFRSEVLQFDLETMEWQTVSPLPYSPVTTACVPWQGSWIVPSGEIRPGVRTNQVMQIQLSKEEQERE